MFFFTCPGIHDRTGGEVVVTNHVFFHTFLVGENVGLGPVLKVGTTNEHKK